MTVIPADPRCRHDAPHDADAGPARRPVDGRTGGRVIAQNVDIDRHRITRCVGCSHTAGHPVPCGARPVIGSTPCACPVEFGTCTGCGSSDHLAFACGVSWARAIEAAL